MKTKLVILITIILSIVIILTNKGGNINGNPLVGMFNPIKIWYKDTTTSLNNGIESYVLQSSSIDSLRKKNSELEKSMLEQKNYIEQTKLVKDMIPSLAKLQPTDKVEIVQTIAYVKINNFTEILLTKPTKVRNGIPYGLISNGVVAGVAKLIDGQFYGYLTSNSNCKLSVQVGSKKAPGVAIGDGKSAMTVQFIPSWFPIKVGDKVSTSGLDGIFYANIPLGVVKKIEMQSSYKVAYINTYNDLYHPKTFFVLSGEKPTVFASSSSIKNSINSVSSMSDSNSTMNTPSSLASSSLVEIDQTRTDVVIPEQTVTPAPKKHIVKKIRRVKKNINNQNKRINNTNENADVLPQVIPISTPPVNMEQPQPLP